MSRDTSASVTSAMAASQIQYALLVRVALNSSTLYACTGNRFVTCVTAASPSNIATYTPIGQFGGIEPLREDAEGRPRTLRMWLAAVSSAHLYEPLTEGLFNKEVRIFRGALTGSYTVVGTPQQMYKGYINKVDIKLGDMERGNYYEVECESRLRREAASAYYTPEFLMQTYSGDTGFDYVSKIANFQSNWGGKQQTLSGLGGAAAAAPGGYNDRAGGYY